MHGKNVDVIRDKDWKGSSLVALVETACTACFFHDTNAETQKQTKKECFLYAMATTSASFLSARTNSSITKCVLVYEEEKIGKREREREKSI